MSGMNKSDQWQNSRMKKRYEAWAKMNTWETHRAKRMKRHAKLVAKHAAHLAARTTRRKPYHGMARALRRHA